MSMAFNFGEQFNAGLQFGVQASQRKRQIEEDYRRAQQQQAYQQALLALSERRQGLAEERLAEDQRRYEAELVDTVGVQAGGPMGFTAVPERIPLRLAQYRDDLRKAEEAREQLATLGQARGEILGIDPEQAQALTPSDVSYLSQQRGDAFQAEQNRLNRQTQLGVANIYAGSRGGGSTPTRTADERLMGEVLAIAPERRMAFINEEISLLENIFPEDRSTSESERLFRLKVARERLNASGAAPSAPQPSGGANFGLMGSQGEALQRVLSQGARQGAPVAPVATPGGNGVPTVETREQFDALEEGAVFFKGGAQYRKRGNQLVRIN